MTLAQCAVLFLALEVGQEHQLPETFAALILSESSAGVYLVGDGGRSVGVGHMKPGTAMDVIRKHPRLWTRSDRPTAAKVRARLLREHRWAMEVKAQHLADLIAAHGWADGVRAYKAGEAGMRRGAGYEGLQVVKDSIGVGRWCK